jgi:hypothetical protein
MEDYQHTLKVGEEAIELINQLVPICEALNAKGSISQIEEEKFIQLYGALRFAGFCYPEYKDKLAGILIGVVFNNEINFDNSGIVRP